MNIHTLTEENKHLKIQIDQRLIELEDWKKKHIEEKESLARGKVDLERKIYTLTEETKHLKIQINQRLIELEEWKKKHSEEKQRFDMNIHTLTDENKHLKIQIEQCLVEVEEWKRKYIEEKQRFEMNIHTFTQENKHLKIQIDQRLIELEEWKKKHNEEKQRFEMNMYTLREENKHLKIQIDQRLIEMEDWKMKYIEEKQNFARDKVELERNIYTLTEENKQLKVQINQRLIELEDWKKKYIELEILRNQEINEYRNQFETLKLIHKFIKETVIKYSADKAADHVYINQLKSLNENYQAEITKLYELLDERKADIEIMHKQNEDLRQSQANIMTRFSKDSASWASTSKDKIEFMQKELENSENAKNEYKKQAERNHIELTRRNQELVKKIQELDILKLKYEEAFANYQALNAKLFERLSISEK